MEERADCLASNSPTAHWRGVNTSETQEAQVFVTRVRACLELGGFWRVLVMHSPTWEMETRLGKVSRPMSSRVC